MNYKITFSLIFIIQAFCLSANTIYLAPINQTYLYSNFSNELLPFYNSTTILKIDNKTTLRLLDEIEFDNGFFGDILKVEVISENNKNITGYVLEDDVKVITGKIKNYRVFFKKDINLSSNYTIKKNAIFYIDDSIIEDNREIVILKPEDNDEIAFIYQNKDDFNFIINKKSELNYYLRKNFNIIYVLNAENCEPIINASIENSKSNDNGIIYIDNIKQNSFITKKGYTKTLITKYSQHQKIYLAFLEQLDYFKFEKNSNFKIDNFFNFEITSDNKGEFGYKILSKNNYSIFSYPPLEQKDFLIKGGFYIESFSSSIKLNLNSIEQDKNEAYFLFNFNETLNNWEIIPSYKKNETITGFDIKTSGYFLLMAKSNLEITKINLNRNYNAAYSNILIRNNGSAIFKSMYLEPDTFKNGLDLYLPKNKYEIVFFSTFKPDDIQKIVIDTSNEKEPFYIDNNLDIKNLNNEEKNEADFLYTGNWRLETIKDNNQIVSGTFNCLEYLGDLEIQKNYFIKISNLNCEMRGYIEPIDSSKLNIHITSVSVPITNRQLDETYFAAPSVFNSNFIIPCNYLHIAGLLQLSFDKIYFSRKRLYTDKFDSNLLMKSISYEKPVFPASSKDAKYNLYFSD